MFPSPGREGSLRERKEKRDIGRDDREGCEILRVGPVELLGRRIRRRRKKDREAPGSEDCGSIRAGDLALPRSRGAKN